MMAYLPMNKLWYSFVWSIVIINMDNRYEVNGNGKTEKQMTLSTNVTKYNCCIRQQKTIDVGHGISGDMIQLDVGYCKNYCPRHFVDNSGDVSRPAVQKCMTNMHCRPKIVRLERIYTIEGIKTAEIIDTCDCSAKQVCRRDVYSQILYSGTPYQVEIDVGICIGRCKKLRCRASKNSSISINGPNGHEVYQVIERCSCTGNCRRMDRIETILDFSGIQIKENMNTTDIKPTVRQINVGQCVGKCSGNSTKACLFQNIQNSNKCIAGVYTSNHDCTPVKFKVNEYRTRQGMKREIIQITQCACV